MIYSLPPALAPEITEAPRDQDAVDGKEINMTCKVYGAPKPEVKWIHDGSELTGGKYTILDNGDLHISNAQFDDSGPYMCYAVNKFGSTNATAKLTIKRKALDYGYLTVVITIIF